MVKMLRGRKSVNIVEYRSRNGLFKDLESVVNVPLLKHKSALIAFNSILNPPEKREKKKGGKTQLAKFIRPEVDKSLLEVSQENGKESVTKSIIPNKLGREFV